jgi:hypothetical protein
VPKSIDAEVNKPSEGWLIRCHIFFDSIGCMVSVIAVYASVINPIWLVFLLLLLSISCVGFYQQDVLFLEQFFDPKCEKNRNIQPCFKPTPQLYQLIGWVIMSTPSVFFGRYPVIICFLSSVPFFSLGQVYVIALIVSLCDVFRVLINSALAIDGHSRNQSDCAYQWIIADHVRSIIKRVNFWVIGVLISLYESMPALINIWLPVFFIPLPACLMLVCGISFFFCNLLLQDSYNFLSPTDDDKVHYYPVYLKYLIASILGCAWLGKVLNKITSFYVFYHFCLIFLPPTFALMAAIIYEFLVVLVGGNYEYTKYMQVFTLLEQKYFQQPPGDIDSSSLFSTSQKKDELEMIGLKSCLTMKSKAINDDHQSDDDTLARRLAH